MLIVKTAAKSVVLVGALVAALPAANAQSTSGVFSPSVDPTDVSAQYRLGLDPDTDEWAQRLHVQSAFNTRLRGRAIVQFERDEGEDPDLDYVQGELLWQLSPDGNENYQTALRFDVRIRPRGEPELFRAIWTNQFSLTPRLSARALLVTGLEVGSEADDGISLETRGRLHYSPDEGPSIGIEMFNAVGSTESIPGFDDQRHQLGPYVSFDVAESWGVQVGALFGLTDAGPDTNLRLWIGRDF